MSNLFMVYKGTRNTETLKFKPVSPVPAVTLIDGYFDFDNNSIEKIEVRVDGSSIDSTTESISYSGNELVVEFNDLDVMEGDYPAFVLAYITNVQEPILLAGPGLANAIIIRVIDLPDVA